MPLSKTGSAVFLRGDGDEKVEPYFSDIGSGRSVGFETDHCQCNAQDVMVACFSLQMSPQSRSMI